MLPLEPASGRREGQESQIVLGILQAIENGDKVTQRAVASELGIALGLVNAYLKRCMKKGLVKVTTAPARRYAYYLTPKGFAEKSKLTASYLTYSFSFFRTARADCQAVLDDAAARGMTRVALIGASELAEIIALCAADGLIEIVGIVDDRKSGRYAGLPVLAAVEQAGCIDGLIVSDLENPLAAYDDAVAAVGRERVLAPAMLRTGRTRSKSRAKSKLDATAKVAP